MRDQLKKCMGIIIWGILFELIVFAWFKELTHLNYASIPPAYVPSEMDRNDIDMETSEIPVAEGDYILELSYGCIVETEWQLVDSDNTILYQGVLDPGQTWLQQSFEIGDGSSEGRGDKESASIRFIVKYAKEGYLSIETFQLNQGTDNILTLQGKDFNCSYLGFKDGGIKEYYINVGRQEFYALNPYHQIVIQNNTSDILYFDLNDCVDYENPQSIITAKKLEAGESWQYRCSDPISYQVVLYSPTAQLEDISVSVDNKVYMDEYKTAVIIMMGMIAAMTVLICIAVLAGTPKTGKKYWNIAAISLHILGIFFYIIKIEPYIINACLLISIFMAAASLLLEDSDKAAEYRQEYNVVFAGFITILLTAGMYIAVLNSGEGTLLSQLGPMNGRALLLYVLFVMVSILLFLISSYITTKHNAIFRKINQYLNRKEALLLGIMLGDFLIKDHVGAMLELDWRRWQMFLVLAMLAVITIYLYRIYRKDNNMGQKKDWAVKALYLFEIISVQINRTLINIYGADSKIHSETHHIGAYYDEITYIAKGEPFRGGETYGHYAVLWRLPMMIFGNNLKVIGIVEGIVAAVTFFFFVLSVHRLFRSGIIRVMASLALWGMFISGILNNVLTIPHRFVFFSVMLYLMVRWQTVELSMKRKLTGHLLCVIALVWNTESGLCVSLAWAVYIVVREIENKDSCFWLAVRKLLIQIVIVGIEVIFFFGSIELYNRFLCDDKVNESEISAQNKDTETEISALNKSIQRESEDAEPDPSVQEEEQENMQQKYLEVLVSEHMGVLFNSNFMDAEMKGVYRFENQPPFSVLVFIVLISFYFLSGTGIIGKSNRKEYEAVALAVCVFALGMFSYEAAKEFARIEKGGIPFLIIFFMIFEKAIYYVKVHPKGYILKNNIVYLLIFFMLIGIVQMELNCYVAVKNFDELLNEKNILDYESMQRDMEQFAYYVPEDTYAYGNGIAEVYMSIGREMPDSSNTQYIVTDAKRDVEDMPYVKVRDIQIGRYIYTLYYNQGYMK